MTGFDIEDDRHCLELYAIIVVCIQLLKKDGRPDTGMSTSRLYIYVPDRPAKPTYCPCSPFAALMCSIVNLRMLLSTRFFGLFTIPWGPWRNSTWLSSGRPWAIVWICKLVPPLLTHLFSSISWQLCIISSQKWCLQICFHGQKMLSY